jgi:hypothetical protein
MADRCGLRWIAGIAPFVTLLPGETITAVPGPMTGWRRAPAG